MNTLFKLCKTTTSISKFCLNMTMSLASSFSLHVPVTASSSPANQGNKIVMLGKKQVFEDQSEGVICYRDENGETVCEGYDEGPRFRQRTFYHLRDAEILDLLQDRWLQIVNGVNDF
ncbi:uncharacterized protein LOC120179722 isoform X2 [Hibiscus syriacus]|uniref:uncharacterized protein LOC120179722 isoform X2 n=1 Tax=Hibiscus syriacus TaxID=106335 RepID=UPI0019222B3F|nr:uncharacterized protein LOC120179722 isoform X2 [Hibiscus syriacus]